MAVGAGRDGFDVFRRDETFTLMGLGAYSRGPFDGTRSNDHLLWWITAHAG